MWEPGFVVWTVEMKYSERRGGCRSDGGSKLPQKAFPCQRSSIFVSNDLKYLMQYKLRLANLVNKKFVITRKC